MTKWTLRWRAAMRRTRTGIYCKHNRNTPPKRRAHPILIMLITALLVAFCIIALLEKQLRPIVVQVAQTQAQNTMTAVVEHAILQDLDARNVSYEQLISIQRDQSGAITALTTDMAGMNLLRAQLISQVLTSLSEINLTSMEIPVGSLFQSELTWGRGPAIQVHAMSVGTVSGEFESEFTSAGINQTKHRIILNLQIPITLMLPATTIVIPVATSLCVAETIIVGKVPDTYLNFDSSLFAPK